MHVVSQDEASGDLRLSLYRRSPGSAGAGTWNAAAAHTFGMRDDAPPHLPWAQAADGSAIAIALNEGRPPELALLHGTSLEVGNSPEPLWP